MGDIEGCSVAEQWERLAKRFVPPSEAAITVTLKAAEARMVHEAIQLAGAYLSAEVKGEHVAGQPPLEGIRSLSALAGEIEASHAVPAASGSQRPAMAPQAGAVEPRTGNGVRRGS